MPSGLGTSAKVAGYRSGAGSPTPRSKRSRSSAHRSNHCGGPDVEISAATLVARRPRTILCVEFGGRVCHTLPIAVASSKGRRRSLSSEARGALRGAARQWLDSRAERVVGFFGGSPRGDRSKLSFWSAIGSHCRPGPLAFRVLPTHRRRTGDDGWDGPRHETYQGSIPWRRWTIPKQGDLAGRSVEIL